MAGPPGTGRTSAIEQFLEAVAHQKPVPDDWCYVNNFADPYRPNALCLPPGQARGLQADIKSLIEEVQRVIRSAFASEEYAARRKEISDMFQQQRDEIFKVIDHRAEEAGFLIQVSPIGLMTLPLVNGKPLQEEQFLALSDATKEEISQRQKARRAELDIALRQAKGLEREAIEAIRRLDQNVARFALNHLIDELQEKYQTLSEVAAYLEEVQSDILASLTEFRQATESKGEEEELDLELPRGIKSSFRKYEVNVMVDNSHPSGASVILELNPTYKTFLAGLSRKPGSVRS